VPSFSLTEFMVGNPSLRGIVGILHYFFSPYAQFVV
jgi:hypothetical protein